MQPSSKSYQSNQFTTSVYGCLKLYTKSIWQPIPVAIVRIVCNQVEAIGTGKQAAISIERYLKYEDLKAGRYLKPKRVIKPPKEGIARMPRQSAPTLPVKQRAGNFKEVKMGINADAMALGAQRCMTCGSRAVITYPGD